MDGANIGTWIDPREELKPWIGQRIAIEARLGRYGTRPSGNRIYQTALANEIEMNGRVICDHCWIDMGKPIQDAGVEPGDLFSATVIVYKYQQQHPDDHNQRVTRYAMRDPREVVVYNRSLLDGRDSECPVPPAPRATSAATTLRLISPREAIQRVRALSDAVGRDALATILPQLTDINATVELLGGPEEFTMLFNDIYGSKP